MYLARKYRILHASAIIDVGSGVSIIDMTTLSSIGAPTTPTKKDIEMSDKTLMDKHEHHKGVQPGMGTTTERIIQTQIRNLEQENYIGVIAFEPIKLHGITLIYFSRTFGTSTWYF